MWPFKKREGSVAIVNNYNNYIGQVSAGGDVRIEISPQTNVEVTQVNAGDVKMSLIKRAAIWCRDHTPEESGSGYIDSGEGGTTRKSKRINLPGGGFAIVIADDRMIEGGGRDWRIFNPDGTTKDMWCPDSSTPGPSSSDEYGG